jgi:hypothetical protein
MLGGRFREEFDFWRSNPEPRLSFSVMVERSEQFAAEFEAAQNDFIKLISSLTDADWRMVGKNYPKRTNDEDEGRTVAVIAHHVAVDGPWLISRIQATLAGRQLQAPDKKQLNAEHATDHASTTREEVLRILRETKPTIAAAVRAIPEDQLDWRRTVQSGR